MKKNGLNLGQLIIALVALALLCLLPFAGFNFGFIKLLQSSLLNLATHVNSVLLLLFLVLILEIVVSLLGQPAVSAGVGLIGLIAGVVVSTMLNSIVINGDYGWILQNITTVYNLLPQNLKSQLPESVTPENIDLVKNIVMGFYKSDIGMWIYLGSQVVYMVCAFLPGIGTAKHHSNGSDSSSTGSRTI